MISCRFIFSEVLGWKASTQTYLTWITPNRHITVSALLFTQLYSSRYQFAPLEKDSYYERLLNYLFVLFRDLSLHIPNYCLKKMSACIPLPLMHTFFSQMEKRILARCPELPPQLLENQEQRAMTAQQVVHSSN